MARAAPSAIFTDMSDREQKAFAELVAVCRRLRAPDGCPWDREQTHKSLRKHLLEEAYEVYDALEGGATPELADEALGLEAFALMGIPFGAVWREVHESNMRKVRAKPDGSDSKRRHGYDVVKPEGWTPPDVRRVLRIAEEKA